MQVDHLLSLERKLNKVIMWLLLCWCYISFLLLQMSTTSYVFWFTRRYFDTIVHWQHTDAHRQYSSTILTACIWTNNCHAAGKLNDWRRAFSVGALYAWTWNTLLTELKLLQCTSTFMHKLKTVLFLWSIQLLTATNASLLVTLHYTRIFFVGNNINNVCYHYC